MSWYRTGTIAVTNGSTAVTGTGTAFVDAVRAGWGIAGPDGRVYEIVSVTNATLLTLGTAYQGSTASGQAYAAFPTRDLGTLPDQLQAVISAMQATIDGAGAGKFGDGTAATPGLRFAADADTGLYRPAANQIGLAAGGVQRALLSDTALSVSVPITGTAVQTDRSDVATPGKLVRTDGALAAALASFGGTHTTNIGRNINTVEAGDAGLYINTNPGTWPAPTPGDSGYWWIATQRTFTDNAVFQIASPYRYAGVPTNTNQFFRVKSRTDGLWSSWVRYLTTGNLLGAVSQSAGVPTGAVIESGSNANGRYTKFASGLLECRQTMAAASGAAVTWTFPSAFIEGPVVTGNAIATVLSALCLDAAPTTTAVTFSARDKTDARRADVVHLHAVGRWSTMV